MKKSDSYQLDHKKRKQGFERSAKTYNEAAILQQEVATRLVERLDYMQIQPKRILDLGAGTGFVTHAVKKKYPKAKVVATDIAINMLKYNHATAPWLKKPSLVCAMAEQLPFADQSFDLVISNFMLQWCADLTTVFSDINRILTPNGLWQFTTFGPDTLHELKACWQQIDDQPHVHPFQDMHDIGDALLQSGLQQPVMDMEMITLTYDSLMPALTDLKKIGATNATPQRPKGLTGKQTFTRLAQAYETYRQSDGQLPVSYEVLYGHAWAAAQGKQAINNKGQADNIIPIYPTQHAKS